MSAKWRPVVGSPRVERGRPGGLVAFHFQDVGDVLALVAPLQGRAVEARAGAGLAGHPDVGEEVHLDSLLAMSFAGLAAAALHVGGKEAGLVDGSARPRGGGGG